MLQPHAFRRAASVSLVLVLLLHALVAVPVHAGSHSKYSAIPSGIPEGFPLPEGGLPSIPLISMLLDDLVSPVCQDPTVGCTSHDECVANTGPGSFCQMGVGQSPPFDCYGCAPETGCCNPVSNEDTVASLMESVPVVCGALADQKEQLKCLTIFQQDHVEVMLAGAFSMYASEVCALFGLCGDVSPFAEYLGDFSLPMSPVISDVLRNTFGNIASTAASGTAARSVDTARAFSPFFDRPPHPNHTPGCDQCSMTLDLMKAMVSIPNIWDAIEQVFHWGCGGFANPGCTTFVTGVMPVIVQMASIIPSATTCYQVDYCAEPITPFFIDIGFEIPPFILAPTSSGTTAALPGRTLSFGPAGALASQVSLSPLPVPDLGFPIPWLTGWPMPTMDLPGVENWPAPGKTPPPDVWDPFATFDFTTVFDHFVETYADGYSPIQ